MFVQYNNLDICVSLEGTVFRVLNIARETLQRIIPSHNHGLESYEIHYTVEGRGKVLVDGMLHDLEPGIVYVVGPGVKHAQIPDFTDQQVDCCIYLQKVEHCQSKTDSIGDVLLSRKFWIGRDNCNMLPVLNRIFDELRERKLGCATLVQALITELLICMIRNYDISGENHDYFRTAELHKARAFIVEEVFLYEYSGITLESLAERLGFGMRQTQRFLMTHYGKSFREMRSEARMSAAKILLSYTNRSMEQISEELGYSTAEHFTVSFKRQFRMAPSEYRRRNAASAGRRIAQVLTPPEGLKSARIQPKG